MGFALFLHVSMILLQRRVGVIGLFMKCILFLQETEAVNSNIGNLYPAFDHLHVHALRNPMPHLQQVKTPINK